MTAAAIFLGVLFVATFAYLTLVWVELQYAAELIKWESARDLLFFQVVADARGATTIPPHDDIVEGPGGNMMIRQQGTLLNYDALKTLMRIMQSQEEDRRISTKNLTASLDKAVSYELINPQPKPPTIFGKRIPIP